MADLAGRQPQMAIAMVRTGAAQTLVEKARQLGEGDNATLVSLLATLRRPTNACFRRRSKQPAANARAWLGGSVS